MNGDIKLAFSHPEDRASATEGAEMPDRISLRDHVVLTEIGAFQQERGHPQRVRFDVVVEVRAAPAPLHDDVDRILSYDKITEAIAFELAAERVNLLETLAERVAERVLRESAAARVFVRIEKLDVGPYALGVEIVRAHGDVPAADAAVEPDLPHPVVVFLDNALIGAPDLGLRLDAWQATGRPVVLTVGLPDLARPVTGHGPTQRRIDLLAIEQNAWVLAARDARCVVVETRTEIEWAMRQGRMVVWAPSKLVLDAVEGPRGHDAGTLAVWLAEQLSAERLIVHGHIAVPSEARIPVIRT
jgi:dihydroneopterin aldolase